MDIPVYWAVSCLYVSRFLAGFRSEGMKRKDMDSEIGNLRHEQGREDPFHLPEDEINLLDLWRVLVRRRRLIFGIWLACVLAGGAYAMLAPPSYEFLTSIEIGADARGEMIDSPGTIRAKVENGYLPLSLDEYRRAHPEDEEAYALEVRVPKKSELVVLRATGRLRESDAYLWIMDSIVGKVVENHNRIIDVQRENLEAELAKATRSLESLADQAKVLKKKQSLISQTRSLLQKQIGELETLVEKAEANRERAIREASDPAHGMTLLLIDQGIQQNRNQLAMVEERLQVKLPEEEKDLERRLADNEREQANQRTEIARIQTMISNLRQTRAIVPPMRSIEPVSPGGALILALALIAGLILGVFGAFFSGFLDGTRRQLAGG